MTRPGKTWKMELPQWHEVTDRPAQPEPGSLVQLRLSWTERRERTRAQEKWCFDNAGTDGIFWRRMESQDRYYSIWQFRDPEVAAMFALTWQ